MSRWPPGWRPSWGLPTTCCAAKGRAGRPRHFDEAAGCAGFPAVLGLAARRLTRCTHCVRCAQTGGGKSDHDARVPRAGRKPCGSSPLHRRAAGGPHGPLLNQRWHATCARITSGSARQARPRGGDLGVAEERSAGVGARTRALCALTRRRCPTATNAVSGGSSATRPRREVPQGSRRQPADSAGAPTGPRLPRRADNRVGIEPPVRDLLHARTAPQRCL